MPALRKNTGGKNNVGTSSAICSRLRSLGGVYILNWFELVWGDGVTLIIHTYYSMCVLVSIIITPSLNEYINGMIEIIRSIELKQHHVLK